LVAPVVGIADFHQASPVFTHVHQAWAQFHAPPLRGA
jgi:hypothetical protein